MSAAGSCQPGQQPPPGAQSPNLSSNNPFRNRNASPSSPDALLASPPSSLSRSRPLSRNPFLDQALPPLHFSSTMTSKAESRSLSAEDIFNSLTLEDKLSQDESSTFTAKSTTSFSKSPPPATVTLLSPKSGTSAPTIAPKSTTAAAIATATMNSPPPAAAAAATPKSTPPAAKPPPAKPSVSKPFASTDAAPAPAPRRPANPQPVQPPAGRGENQALARPLGRRHRPTRSQEEELRRRKPQASAPPSSRPGPSSGQAPAPRKSQRRPRRNSDTSVMDLDTQPITEDELKMIEAKRMRERQRRETREPKEKTKSGRPSRRLDIIDQLDATSIYGTGLFHHDGPFDALNPHRNRQNSRRAPMQAFPKDSLNNSIGGAGPLNATPDHSVFMGNGTEEAFRDFAACAKYKHDYSVPPVTDPEAAIFDPICRGSIVHGDESFGLGTSTFLEGTPAARTAIARRQAEQAQEFETSLQRKKSLAQRIRHINKGPREVLPSGRTTNPESVYSKRSPDAGLSEPNPFSAEFSKGEDTISVRPTPGTVPTSSSPPRRRMSEGPMDRRPPSDGDDAPAKPAGILGRMKSLKGGGRRPRNAEPAQVPNPGTAI